MNNIKALKEKRNELLSKADSMLNVAEKETRSLTDDETSKFSSVETEIRSLDEKIVEIEDRQFDDKKIDKTTEERNMEDTSLEVRGLEQYLRRKDGEEVRSLSVTADGGAVIPENVEGTIVLKMEETSPVFEKARKFASESGTLKIAKETSNTVAGFVGEGNNVKEGNISFDEVKLTQKRVGAAISLSNQLINDSAVNIVDYAISLLARRTGKAVEQSILVGKGGEEFSGITDDKEIVRVDVDGAVTQDTLLDLYNQVHPAFLDGAGYIVSRKFFNQIAKLKDGNGHFFLQNGVVNGKLSYTLFGAEVTVTDALPDETPAIFGSVEQAYGVLIKQGFGLQHVTGDTTQALRGSQLLVLDGYMDGAVYNPQALSILNSTVTEDVA
ncbi:phage major capsid protein [Staphylococcus equorum]|uniref:Phage major capsid protein n=1 Tax=Staphylococcus equorum TaxID=246432 RepID=A0A9X4LCM3_9STAP|nr:phage major capsid protein [Staphylococcus equorum]MDG0860319.1 phage major capsid protein [Staphylococcus equorum]